MKAKRSAVKSLSLTILIKVSKSHNTSNPSPPPQKTVMNRPNGQQKPGKLSTFSLLYSKEENILFRHAFLSISLAILNSIQCLVEHSALSVTPRRNLKKMDGAARRSFLGVKKAVLLG